jgi:hypothetical protein
MTELIPEVIIQHALADVWKKCHLFTIPAIFEQSYPFDGIVQKLAIKQE